MMILHSTGKDEVLRQLHKLTSASNLEKHSNHAVFRHMGVVAYRQAYDWLEAHHILFAYDRSQSCYVEVEDEHAD